MNETGNGSSQMFHLISINVKIGDKRHSCLDHILLDLEQRGVGYSCLFILDQVSQTLSVWTLPPPNVPTYSHAWYLIRNENGLTFIKFIFLYFQTDIFTSFYLEYFFLQWM